ncbi:PREDICTED: sodium-dependent proline transporter-like [Priapulus caudatus]|uniref:Sodium-dependent proline transporter-like n=1 Tax=Priapulus caudatus TaxID=37621 RepID=A0ABM1F626_PRICU|nr:PREDICTED: sodium-dependent proline transporter-like [Priapulus caudatus]
MEFAHAQVVYFTATFPYVILIILLVRGATLPGAAQGIRFYITPDLSVLSTPQVWFDAAGQVFFSLGVAFGGTMTLSSYNRFRHNCLRDALILVLGNCIVSFLAGIVIFSMLGHMAHDLDKQVSEVARSGA